MKTKFQNDEKLNKMLIFITTLTILWSVIIVENCGILAHHPEETIETHETYYQNDFNENVVFKNIWNKIDRLFKKENESEIENSNTYAAVRG